MQIAVVGDAGCGKTSLIRAIVGLDFDPHSPPTDRKTTYEAILSSAGEIYDASDVTTFIDCGPIEDELALEHLLKGVACVIVSYDCSNRQSFESARDVWMQAVRSACKNAQVFFLLVGCKSDASGREVSVSEVETFANKQNVFFLETSCLSSTNIDLLIKVLKLKVSRLQSGGRNSSTTTRSARSPQQEEKIAPVPTNSEGEVFFRGSDDLPTTLRIHRTGSVDLSSQAAGVNLHISRDGTMVKTESKLLAIKNESKVPSNAHEEPFPLLVDVRMGGGNIGTIIVHSRNDDPYALAELFIRQHGLDIKRAPELARVVKARLDEYFVPSAQVDNRPIAASVRSAEPKYDAADISKLRNRTQNGYSGAPPIIARLKLAVDQNTTAVVAVREGDEPGKLVEAFRRTYALHQDHPLLHQLTNQIQDSLYNSGGRAEDDAFHPIGTQQRSPYLTSAAFAHHQPPAPKSYTSESYASDSNGMATRNSAPAQFVQVKSRSPVQQSSIKQEARHDEMVHVEKPLNHFALDQYEDHPPQPEPATQFVRDVRPSPAAAGTPTNPPPPPPSKYSQKPSPIPYRTPQTPVGRPQQGPGTASRSISSPAARPAQTPTTVRSLRSPTKIVGGTSSSGKRVGRPLFYVDVNLGGKSDRVAVHKDDNLKEVAEQFLEANNISKTKTLKLTQLLEYHLRLHQKSRRSGQ